MNKKELLLEDLEILDTGIQLIHQEIVNRHDRDWLLYRIGSVYADFARLEQRIKELELNDADIHDKSQ